MLRIRKTSEFAAKPETKNAAAASCHTAVPGLARSWTALPQHRSAPQKNPNGRLVNNSFTPEKIALHLSVSLSPSLDLSAPAAHDT